MGSEGEKLLEMLDNEAAPLVWEALKRKDYDQVYQVMVKRRDIRVQIKGRFGLRLEEEE